MSNPIEEAIAALRHGDQATAFTLLRARLAQEPTDASAWLWMSEATADIHRKVEALTRFLALAPSHPHAPSVRLRLQQLQSQLAGSPNDAKPKESLLNDPVIPTITMEPPSDPLPVATAPAPSSAPSLRDRIATAPQPIIEAEPPAPVAETTPPEPTIPTPVFTPRPAAPPPPNFKALRAEGEDDDGLPMWVWGLMGLALVLVGLFIYLILNFERFLSFFQ